jgi:aspartate/methionine/tyrosine aminotransferase
VHDFITVGAAAPLQQAGVTALEMPPVYYEKLAAEYERRRDTLLGILGAAGFGCVAPEGAYYILADIGAFGFTDDVMFIRHLIERVGVAAVPGSSFFSDPRDGSNIIRFCFCKKYETLCEAGDRLSHRL